MFKALIILAITLSSLSASAASLRCLGADFGKEEIFFDGLFNPQSTLNIPAYRGISYQVKLISSRKLSITTFKNGEPVDNNTTSLPASATILVNGDELVLTCETRK